MPSGTMTVNVSAGVPVSGGLLDFLTATGGLHDEQDPHLGAGIVYETAVCGPAALAPGLCDDALGLDPDTEKTFAAPEHDESLAFAVYAGVICSPFYRDYEERSRASLNVGEGWAVETAVSALHFETATSYNAGTAYSVTKAIAIAERLIGSTGARYISVSRYGAAFLAESRNVKGDDINLATVQGTPIINGGGFQETGPAASAALTGDQFYIFVHGPIDLFRGPVLYNQGLNHSTNEEVGLAERVYASVVQCGVVAILVDPSV